MDEESWWCGTSRLGDVVFDPDVQTDTVTVLLYLANGKQVVKFIANEVRGMFKPQRDQQQAELTLSKYREWKYFYSSRLKKVIAEKPYSFEAKRSEVTAEHQKFLAMRDLPFRGESIDSDKPRRQTHCYECKQELDSFLDVECNVCRWIVCSCGACGCGFKKSI